MSSGILARFFFLDKPPFNKCIPILLVHTMDHDVEEKIEIPTFALRPPGAIIPRQMSLEVFLQNLVIKHTYLLDTLGSNPLTLRKVLEDVVHVIPVRTTDGQSRKFIV